MVTELNGGAEHERVVYLCVAAGQAVGLDASGVEPQVFINYARDSTTLGSSSLFHYVDTVLGQERVHAAAILTSRTHRRRFRSS